MVEAEGVAPTVTTMVLPMSMNRPRLRESTAYQLQPESMLNHSGMLPAAALSNFFKAPSSPLLNSRLPTIPCGDGIPKISKSIHQRNKCLAEVIQSQLMELKKLQGKHHRLYKSTDNVCNGVHKMGMSNYQPVNGDEQVASSFLSKKKISNDSSRVLLTPDAKLLTHHCTDKSKVQSGTVTSQHSTMVTKATHPNIFLTTPPGTQFQSSLTKFPQPPSKSSPESLCTPDTINMAPSCNLSLTPGATPNHSLISPLVSPSRSSYTTNSSMAVHPAAPPLSYMDPAKFLAVKSWAENVDTIQKLEGKCSDVISIPDIQRD